VCRLGQSSISRPSGAITKGVYSESDHGPVRGKWGGGRYPCSFLRRAKKPNFPQHLHLKIEHEEGEPSGVSGPNIGHLSYCHIPKTTSHIDISKFHQSNSHTLVFTNCPQSQHHPKRAPNPNYGKTTRKISPLSFLKRVSNNYYLSAKFRSPSLLPPPP
jgi:hypothetical protein